MRDAMVAAGWVRTSINRHVSRIRHVFKRAMSSEQPQDGAPPQRASHPHRTQGQAILTPYLLRDGDDCYFSPRESEKKRRREQHDGRTTPLNCSNRPGTNRQRLPRRSRPI